MRLESQRFDQYHLMRLLKRGGMGEIYLAEDEKLNRQVAIKVIRTDNVNYLDEEEGRSAARLFLREVRVVAQLDHQHILPLFDAGETEIDGTPLFYMVMPLREEGSFAEWLARYGRGRPLSPQYVERVVKQAASALQHAHDHDIIHLDVKPSNFLIKDPAPHPRQLYLQLADFGIARLMTSTSHSRIIRGTPTHMAPEQWEGRAVAASDQYALGVMAYELLTGQPPFQGNDQQNMWYQHASLTPARPGQLNPHLPPGLDAVLLRALAKAPQARYSSVTAFALAFQNALRDTGNVRQQLTISGIEARTGTRRIISVNGRQLALDIPPGVQDGQVLYLEGLGEKSMYGGQPGTLILTIVIAHAQHVVTLADTGHLPPTVVAPPPPAFDYEELPPEPPQRQKTPILKTMFLLSAICLVILGSAIALTLINSNPSSKPKVNTPGPTPNLRASAAANATVHAQSSATAGANATATTVVRQAHASATAGAAQSNATVTAIAGQHATATAVVAIAIQNYNTMEQNASLDPLQTNSPEYQWDEIYQPNAGGCEFQNSAYHAVVLKVGSGFYSPCFAEATSGSNFFFEAQAQIVQGDEAGILFRGNSKNGTFYCFHIDASGAYGLDIYGPNNTVTPTAANGTSNLIDTTPGAINLIAVKAQGTSLTIYINKQEITTITDTTFTVGQIGVFAASQTQDTDVLFSNVRFGAI